MAADDSPSPAPVRGRGEGGLEKSELAKNRFAPYFLPFFRKSLISMIIPDNSISLLKAYKRIRRQVSRKQSQVSGGLGA